MTQQPGGRDAATDVADTTDAVVVEHLRVVRGGRDVLPDLTVTVPRGQVVGLLGPSGGGKSTLMRAVVGVQVVEGGTVTVLGEPAGSPGLRRRVAYVTQAPSVYGDLTVRENARYFARVLGVGTEAADRAVETVDLVSHADARVENLSGGQRSRVSLACALVGDPEVLVLDEPTVGLDPVLRRDLWGMFRHLAEDEGRTVFVSSHVMDEAVRCDRLLLLREGHVLSDSTLPELLERTGTSDAEQAFLALVDAEAGRTAGGRTAGGGGGGGPAGGTGGEAA
ncbi:ABC transporter ATP-binding protein [Oryzobacter terrae]|uniref:ABC transporter ATP-binding protein n=1 Tax=Oryzobacter terrae TaxID=1620385 RepID=UPI00367195B1